MEVSGNTSGVYQDRLQQIFDQVQEAFDLADSKEDGALKVLLTF